MLKSFAKLAAVAAVAITAFVAPAQASDKTELLNDANGVVNDLLDTY